MRKFASAQLSLSLLFAVSLCAMVGTGAPGSAAASPAQVPLSAVCHKSIPQIYDEDSPAVVYITTQTIRPYQFTDRVSQGVASGFIFDSRGLILTNFHVVLGASAVQVTLDDGDTYSATVVGGDAIFDLAVLRIRPDPDEKLPTLSFGDSAALRVGDDVVAIGNPLGLDQTLTHGVVSGLNRELPDTPLSLTPKMIQTDASINPGNSGGPLLNRCGEVVGINAEILDNSQGLGFAIPIDLAKVVLPSLLATGHVRRPWIGFHGELVDRATARFLNIRHAPALLVEAVDADSPAAKAGMRGGSLDIAIAGREFLVGGDVVTAINGVRLDSPEALGAIRSTLRIGREIKITVYRDGKRRTVSYRLLERPAVTAADVTGIRNQD